MPNLLCEKSRFMCYATPAERKCINATQARMAKGPLKAEYRGVSGVVRRGAMLTAKLSERTLWRLLQSGRGIKGASRIVDIAVRRHLDTVLNEE